MRAVHLVNLGLLGALVLGSIAVWPELPESIPAHLGASGEATRWTAKSPGAWFLLPGLALLLAALFYGVNGLLPGRPQLLNFPDKRRFLALPPERQAPIIHLAQNALYWVAAHSIALLGLIQLGMYRAALGRPDRMLTLVILLFAVAVVPLLLFPLLGKLQAETDRQVRLHGEAARGR